MKHSELLKLIHDNREFIDRVYKQNYIQNVPQELIDSTLFVKIHDKYKLNKNYLNFVDSVLQRIDYSIIFGDYEKEYKELVKNKKRYLESEDEFYINRIISLIENLYIKFYNRDREIQILLLRLENDTSLEIDKLLEQADDTLEKIDELIDANEKIGDFFRKGLRGVHGEIDTLLQSISVGMLKFIEKIDDYISEFNQFIIQTKKRRILNKKIIKLSNMILDEQVNDLDEYLTLHYKSLYFTLPKSQKNKIQTFVQDEDISKIKKELLQYLSHVEIKKPIKRSIIKEQKHEKLKIVNIDKIMKELEKQKSEDIFLYLLSHHEFSKYEKSELISEAFKAYLQIITDTRVVFGDNFNEFDIKVAKWQ